MGDGDSGGTTGSGVGSDPGYSPGDSGYGFGGFSGPTNNGLISTEDVANYSPSLSFSYGDMDGFGGMSTKSSDMAPGWAAGADDDEGMVSKFMKHPVVRFLAPLVARANPALSLGMKAYGLYSAANSPAGALGMAGNTLGGMAGAGLGGPVGGIAGAYAGGKAGAYAANNSGGNAGPGAGGGGHGGGDFNSEMLAGLGSLYAGRQSQRGVDQQINNLQGLYSPTGAYAQQLRQTLERRDAAAHRRSQYGPRETELMARLASQGAQSAPQMQQLYNQRDANRAGMLRDGLTAYDRLGGVSGIKRGLGDIYQGGVDAYNSFFG